SGPVGPKGDTGATGITDAGVYSTISAYAIRDAVLDNGSTWLAKSAVPAGNPPPVLPATQNDYWRLLARRGIDGTGIGDVVGPTGGVSVNDLAVFADTTGKLLKKAPNNVVSNALLSQLSAPAIKGRLTIGSGDVEDLTPAQARQLLGGWEYITTIGVGSGSVVAITNLSAFYSIRITQRTILTTGGYLGIQVSTDNGATFLTSTTDYRYNIVDNYFNGSTSTVSGGDGGIAQMPIGDENSSGIITMSAFNAPLVAYSVGQSISDVGSNRVLRNIGHKITGTTPRNALRIIAPVGTFLHGVFVVEGVRL
ncbi:fusion protein, partial [Agrobacterium rhizogenes]|nr:fusion protein [Rhizobium rhizogenes]